MDPAPGYGPGAGHRLTPTISMSTGRSAQLAQPKADGDRRGGGGGGGGGEDAGDATAVLVAGAPGRSMRRRLPD